MYFNIEVQSIYIFKIIKKRNNFTSQKMDNITIMEIETIIHESIKEDINIKKIIKKNISKKYGKNRHENIER